MARPNPAPTDPIAELGQLGPLRVWSVIITIFGDAVMPRGGTVPASTLSAITERLAIKPEALRVALHRLARDGWITRAKSGRNAFYALSDRGRDQFLPATRRIYAAAPELSGPWRLAGLPPLPEAERAACADQLRKAGFLPLSPHLYLGPKQADPAPTGAMVVSGALTQPPDWVATALAPDPLPRDYARLAEVLERVRQTAGPDPLDAVALRILAVHQWRRLLLRHADLPSEILPRGWRGEDSRALLRALHKELSAAADPWLDTAIGLRK